MTWIETTINGQSVRCEVEPRRRLVEFLREDRHLYGTKISCEVQVCGSCTVLVDGLPVSSCTYLAVDVEGCQVVTVEGLATDGELSSVQQAFLAESAVQCGYCTAGFLCGVTALLEENPDPDEEEIREHLDGYLCRCTGYSQILAAVQRAAGSGDRRLA